jgi:hypothetical protein
MEASCTHLLEGCSDVGEVGEEGIILGTSVKVSGDWCTIPEEEDPLLWMEASCTPLRLEGCSDVGEVGEEGITLGTSVKVSGDLCTIPEDDDSLLLSFTKPENCKQLND